MQTMRDGDVLHLPLLILRVSLWDSIAFVNYEKHVVDDIPPDLKASGRYSKY